MASAADIGLSRCIDQFNRLEESEKKLINLLYINNAYKEVSTYFQYMVTLINQSKDCGFWFDDYGKYTRLSTSNERGYKLTELLNINYNNLNDLEDHQRRLDFIIGSLYTSLPFYEDPLSRGFPNDLEKRVYETLL